MLALIALVAVSSAQSLPQYGRSTAVEGGYTDHADRCRSRADRDGDCIDDADELDLGTDPTHADTDGDGLLDGEEVDQYGTDPLVVDTDGDGMSDGEEVHVLGSEPTVADAAPAALTVSYCLSYATGAAASTVYTSAETAPDACVFDLELGVVYDGPGAGLVPVYRHTSTDGRASHRLSLDGAATAGESRFEERVFFAEAAGAGVGDEVWSCTDDSLSVLHDGSGSTAACDTDVLLFEAVW